ncbi:hypothetical protein [Thalassococcus halodurans]|uniref:hypothetical protein n=1 Tax=Thalassococcus halodurans TaxID=373675 RepID=UPI001357B35B|nr:hypothetical protein [Thalassococcus halodurans]
MDDARGGDPAYELLDFSQPNPKESSALSQARQIAAAWARVVDARRPSALIPRFGP